MSNLVSLIENSPYFKEKFKKLDNFQYDHLRANDIHGVDCCVDFDIDKLNIDAPRDEIRDALEEILADDGVHFDRECGYIYSSTSDEIWIVEGGRRDGTVIVFPEGGRREYGREQELIRGEDGEYDDFYTRLLIEEFVLRTGYFPGIFSQDYYGNVEEYKFDEKLMELFPQEEKARKAMVNDFLQIYKVQHDLNEGYRTDMYDIPDRFIENLPERFRADDVNLLRIKDIFPTHIQIEIEYDNEEEEEDLVVEVIDIPTLQNSIRFILEA